MAQREKPLGQCKKILVIPQKSCLIFDWTESLRKVEVKRTSRKDKAKIYLRGGIQGEGGNGARREMGER